MWALNIVIVYGWLQTCHINRMLVVSHPPQATKLVSWLDKTEISKQMWVAISLSLMADYKDIKH
jgi:hypothetical protein